MRGRGILSTLQFVLALWNFPLEPLEVIIFREARVSWR